MVTLTRYTPGFGTLRHEIDRMFDQLQGIRRTENTSVWTPRTDISELDDRYVIRMDTPGLTRKDLEVQLHQGVLSVSGERKSEHEEKGEKWYKAERRYGRFNRSFTLPEASDENKVTASLKDGVLTIEVKKHEEKKPRQIKIS